MTDKGALVIIFLDTCHAGALFVGHEPKNNELKGAIAFFPSSKPEQSSFEIERKTLFSYNILETFKHKNGIAFDVGKPTQFISLGGIEKIIKYAFDGNNDQTPEPKFFSKDGKIDNYKIKYYPIIEQGKINTVNKQKNRFYGGIAVGSNHTCTPFADVNLGVDINNSYKIEVGFTHSLKKTDEVYMYDNNGIIQNALQYKAMSFYARYGFNWLSLCKDKRRSEFITLVGLSGNIVKGDNLSGFNSSIGKTAGSLMGDVCCRWALDLSKNNKRNVLLHMTAGFDFPIKRDGNVCNVLNSEKYIKNWCSFRPYIEAGVIISPKFLSF